jgi:GDP/UDP-N,N'-diacetylbacillosamine 2-epimerase (hydrolysing)
VVTNYKIIRVAVLTSSRADFGIYLPLLKKISNSNELFNLKIVAFGTHLSKFHGYTKDEMITQGFNPDFEITTLLSNDRPEDISCAYALTALKFSDFWSAHRNEFDWILCLGDRFEMAAAVAAGIPFGLKFAHIHGGETTLGAIDNIYRHSISLVSRLHFLSAEPFKKRIKELIGTDENAVVTGSLSLDNLDDVELLSKDAFKKKWLIDLNEPSILITIHPETVAYIENEKYSFECHNAFNELVKKYQLIITMPNADTYGSIFRNMFKILKKNNDAKVHLIENFGTQSYFTCMKYCNLMIGNTSSGIVEAASFNKYVINLGDRQKGRLCGDNVIHLPFEKNSITQYVAAFADKIFHGENIYRLGNASDLILKNLNPLFNGVVS